jgi:ABC-type dipeptide/oligopeptide/nickel transport system permease subunit
LTDPAAEALVAGFAHAEGGQLTANGLPEGPTEPGTPDGGEVAVITSGWRLSLREFMSNRLAVIGVIVLVFFALFSFVGPILDPTNQSLANPALSDNPPTGTHIFGYNDQGFDEVGAIMRGGQTSFEIGALSAAMAIVVGTLYGAISGLAGGIVDTIMMRVVDVGLSLPYLLVILVLATKFNSNVLEIAGILAAFSWLVPARLVRGEVLTLRERDFVWAARVMGARQSRLVFKHLIPNALSVTIVNVTFLIADSILALSYLGFLGFGLSYPQTSWGDMLANALQYLNSGYWWLVYPVGACLVIVVLAFNLVGDGLRDALDVRLRRR